MAEYSDFQKLKIASGTIIEASFFNEAKKPAYKLKIDFGELGILKSSAQITHFYTVDSLIGKQIIAVINFPPKQIANFISECLVLGSVNENGEVVLLTSDFPVKNGLLIS